MVSFSKALIVLLAMRNFDRSSGALRNGRRRARADRVGRQLKTTTTTTVNPSDGAATTKAATTKKAGGGGGGGDSGDEWWNDPNYDDPNQNKLGQPCSAQGTQPGPCLAGETCRFPSDAGRDLQIGPPTGTCVCTPNQDVDGCGTGYSCEDGLGGPTCTVVANSRSSFQQCDASVQCNGSDLRCCYYQAWVCLDWQNYPAMASGRYCKD